MARQRAQAGDVVRLNSNGRVGVIVTMMRPWMVILEPEADAPDDHPGELVYPDRSEFEILSYAEKEAHDERVTDRAARVFLRALESGAPILTPPPRVAVRALEIMKEGSVGQEGS